MAREVDQLRLALKSAEGRKNDAELCPVIAQMLEQGMLRYQPSGPHGPYWWAFSDTSMFAEALESISPVGYVFPRMVHRREDWSLYQPTWGTRHLLACPRR